MTTAQITVPRQHTFLRKHALVSWLVFMATTLGLMAGAIVFSPAASANVSIGEGSGVGGSGNISGEAWRWNVIRPSGSDSAFERAWKDMGYLQGDINSRGVPNHMWTQLFGHESDSFLETCLNTDNETSFVAWTSNHTSPRTPGMNPSTYIPGSVYADTRTISPAPWNTTSPQGIPSNYWATYVSNSNLWDSGNIDFICVDELELFFDETRTEERFRTLSDETSVRGITHLGTDVKPGINFSNEIGDSELHAQNLNSTTPFGEFWNEINQGRWDNANHSYLADRANRLARESNIFTNNGNLRNDRQTSLIGLGEQNQSALGEGGVLNFLELHRYAEIEFPTTQNQISTRQVEVRVYPDGSEEVLDTGSWSSWRDSGSRNENNPAGNAAESYQAHSAYQVVGAVCNPDEFDNVLNALGNGAENITVGHRSEVDTNQHHMARGPVQDLNNSSPNWALGNSNHSNPFIALTGDVDFYTKLCNFVCTPDDDGLEHYFTENPDDLRSNEDAVNQVNRNVSNENSMHSHNVGDNELILGRDNEYRYLDFTVPTPDEAEDLNLSPTQTIVERWNEGSLSPATNDGSTMTITALDEDRDIGHYLFRGDDTIKLRNDGTATLGHNDTVSVLDGVYTAFGVAGNWATTSEHPEVLNISWVWQGEHKTNFPAAFYGTGNTAPGDWVSDVDGSEYTGPSQEITVGGRCGTQFSHSSDGDSGATDWDHNDLTGAEAVYEGNQDFLGDSNNPNNLVLHFSRQIQER